MATMNISLPDKMKAWVEEQSKTGKYANSSDYVRDLIRADESRRRMWAEVQIEVDKGIASGVSKRSWDEIMELARARAKAAAAKKRDRVSNDA
jgi:antitoxin ParD1/3/4